MRALRIAVDVTPIQVGGECGGAKPFVIELIKGLAAATRRHDYRLLTAAHNHEAFASHEAPNVTRQRVDTTEARSVAQGLRQAGIDLLFCPMTAPTYAEDGPPTVSVLYDLQHLAYPEFFDRTELAHRARFYRDLVHRVHHVVCISEFSRASLIEHFHVPRDRTSVVPIAIQDRLPHVEPGAAWTALASRGVPRRPFAFYPANFWPHKNHRLLLLAFRRFLSEHPESDLQLVLTGEPLGESAYVRAAIERMGLSSRVHVAGFVSEAELGALWSAASLLVFPSLYEGFGIPLTEAMAFDVPILCSREGSLPEVGGEDAAYFDARTPQTLVDALALAVDRPDEMRRMAVRARGRLSAFSPGVVVDRYLDVIEHVAADASSMRVPMVTALEPAPAGEGRRARASRLMRSGRALYRTGRRLRGVSVLAAGAVLAPEAAGRALLRRTLKPVRSRSERRPADGGRSPVRPETEAWMGIASLHKDGWAGPTLTVGADVQPDHSTLTVHATTEPTRLGGPLELELFVDRRSLGRQRVDNESQFALTWNIADVPRGLHELRIVASAFLVPHDHLGNHDYRPLSYRLTEVQLGDRMTAPRPAPPTRVR